MCKLRPPPFPAHWPHALLLAAGAALVALMDYRFAASGFGPLVSYAEMVNRPEFYAGGRYAILPLPSIFWELISPWGMDSPLPGFGTAGRDCGLRGPGCRHPLGS